MNKSNRTKIGILTGVITLGLIITAAVVASCGIEGRKVFGLSGLILSFGALGFLVRETVRETKRRDLLEVEVAKANSQFRLVLDSNLIGVLLWDSGGTIVDANPAFLSLSEYTRSSVDGRDLSWTRLTPSLDRVRLEEALGTTERESKCRPFEMEILSRTGKLVPVLVVMARLEGPSGTAVAFIMDRRDQRLVELKLADYTRAVEESNRDLQEFAYVASHDLQEPLRMVSSFMQLLSERYKGKLDQDADDYIAFAVDGASRMKQLIQDLLSFARLNREEKGFSDVPMSAALEKAKNSLSLVIQESGTKLTSGELPTISGYSSQLEQLLQNLIGNAIKFRNQDTYPEIHVSAERRGDQWCFCIRDNGIGIEKQYLENIFGIFKRLHVKEKYSGSGIGLAICRRIVSLHGGRIWAESELGQGSQFYFTMPLQRGTDHGHRT